MQFLYPSDYFKATQIDEQYRDEARAFKEAGFSVATLAQDRDIDGKSINGLKQNEAVCYRGWMLTAQDYEALARAVKDHGAELATPLSQYLQAHYIPNWYPRVKEWTAETLFFPPDADLTAELSGVAWEGFFLKDYVKSLKTSVGSVVRKLDDIAAVVSEMKKFRGTIEGGFSVRRLEDYDDGSERRYFVYQGVPYSGDNSEIPLAVCECVDRMESPFFSVDTAYRSDGVLRIIEIGDGQVSDTVGWSIQNFVNIFCQRMA